MDNQPADPAQALREAAIELLSQSKRRGTLPVEGTSMLPTLRPGRRVLTEFSTEALRRGEILLFRQNDTMVVHRLLDSARAAQRSDQLRTRGDGRLTLDPPLTRDRVLGRVVAVEDAGQWRSFDGAAARVYATALALHDIWWARMGRIAGRLEALFARVGLRVPLRSLAWTVDREGLWLTHRVFFRAVHRRIDSPDETDHASRSNPS